VANLRQLIELPEVFFRAGVAGGAPVTIICRSFAHGRAGRRGRGPLRMARVKAILFDLGDTLLDFGPVDTLGLFARGARLAYRYLQRLGKPLPAFRAYHRAQLRAIRWHYVKSRLTRREFNSLDVLRRLGRAMGHELTDEQVVELAWQWYVPLGRCVTVEEGLAELLAGLRDEGIRLAVVSNTFVPGQVLDRHLGRLGLLELLPTRIYSCDVGWRKPTPAIFRLALERVGAPAEEAIFVGDSLAADVRGAARVGMTAVLKDPTGARRRWRVRPDHRITSLGELRPIVDARNRPSAGAAGAGETTPRGATA